MKQTGLCLLSCPNGYYHTRSRDINKCMKCRLDCDCDFTGNFCTRCREGQYLHRGKCHGSCPEGLVPDSRLWECIPAKVHCEVDEWNAWSPCSHRGITCGFKAGEQTRVRGILQLPSHGGNDCSTTSETRECFIRKRKCSGRLHREKQRGRKKKREGGNMGESPRLKGEGGSGRKKMRGWQGGRTGVGT
ncbi:R-spondin-3-like isoform X2 [Brienomyrus brachyistius]|nr:R-spondin-3-like isoform X2 [Brienomyrus brachyistius]